MNIASQGEMVLYGQSTVGIKADGSLALQSKTTGSFDGGASLRLKAFRIDLNGLPATPVKTPRLYPKTTLDDTVFNNSTGWQVKSKSLESIVTRAPTHEPYPYHNKGVAVNVNLGGTQAPTPPPAAEPVPTNWSIIRKS
jgi:hypothetical protein